MGRVTKRARDLDGKPLGTAHDNPILDTRQYIVRHYPRNRHIQVSYHEDNDSPFEEGSPDEILPTPEGSDNYVNVEIMLPRGDEMSSAQWFAV